MNSPTQQSQKKIVIEAKDGQVLLGAHFHELKDESINKFETDDIDTFFRLIKTLNSKPFALYFSHDRIHAVPDNANRYGDDIAALSLSETGSLGELRRSNGSKKTITRFEDFLRKMRPYMDEGGMALLANLKDFRVHKVSSIIRKKNRKTGDYEYTVSREAVGKEDFDPPEFINFKLPVFEHMDECVEVQMEFAFDFTQNEEDVEMEFSLENIQLGEIIEARQKLILEGRLKGTDMLAYWGHVESSTRDNSWMYKRNQQ